MPLPIFLVVLMTVVLVLYAVVRKTKTYPKTAAGVEQALDDTFRDRLDREDARKIIVAATTGYPDETSRYLAQVYLVQRSRGEMRRLKEDSVKIAEQAPKIAALVERMGGLDEEKPAG